MQKILKTLIVSDAPSQNVLWVIYSESFKKVNECSPCKQSFDKVEFMDVLTNDTVIKYVLYDEKEIIGIGLITNKFKNLPWISSDYFHKNYPSEFENNQVYYFMGIAIKKGSRGIGNAKSLINYIIHDFKGKILGFDHSVVVNPLIPKFTLLIRNKKTSKKKIESQNYYCLTIKD